MRNYASQCLVKYYKKATFVLKAGIHWVILKTGKSLSSKVFIKSLSKDRTHLRAVSKENKISLLLSWNLNSTELDRKSRVKIK